MNELMNFFESIELNFLNLLYFWNEWYSGSILNIWRVEEANKVRIEQQNYGIFYSAESYIILVSILGVVGVLQKIEISVSSSDDVPIFLFFFAL